MNIEAHVTIDGTKEAIWSVITDIPNAAETISGIDSVEILENRSDGLVGLRWRETRTLFGKSATEEMWITDAAEHEYYKTRAESHGCVYKSSFVITGQNGSNLLTMTFVSEPQGFMTKLLTLPMGITFKPMLKKAILKDLQDIKAAVEGRSETQQ